MTNDTSVNKTKLKMCTPAISNIEEIAKNFDNSKFICFCGDIFDKRPRLTDHQQGKSKKEECIERICDNCGKILKSFNFFVAHTKKCAKKPKKMAKIGSPADILMQLGSIDDETLEKVVMVLKSASNHAASTSSANTTVNILFCFNSLQLSQF